MQHKLFCRVVHEKHIFAIFLNYHYALFEIIKHLLVAWAQNFWLDERKSNESDHNVNYCAEEARPQQVEYQPIDDHWINHLTV